MPNESRRRGAAVDSAAVEVPPAPVSRADVERILAFAWHRFNSYDSQSGDLKKRYRRIRAAIILISWLTTALAVLSAFAQAQAKQILDGALVALPLISAGLLAYAMRFETGVAWVAYRLAAEAIKRGMYTLRVRASLKALDTEDLKQITTTIHETSERLDSMGVSTPMATQELALDMGRILPKFVDNEKKDDGYAPMSIEEYIHWRLVPQTNWYRTRVKQDYRRTRLFRIAILFTGAAGAFLAAIGRGELVAITVAGVTALGAWLGLMLHETNYGIYMRTIIKLEDTLGAFLVDFAPPAAETPAQKARALAFVRSIEDIFSEERELWRLSVLQRQEATEGTLSQMVSAFRREGSTVDRLADRSASAR